MQLVDHLFVLLLFVVQPLYSAHEFRSYQRMIAAGKALDRVRFYRLTLIAEWLAFAALAVAWVYLGRPFADLGFSQPAGAGFWIGAALLLVATGLLLYSWQRARTMTDSEKRTQADSLGFVAHFLPHTVGDLRRFYGVSVTAGVVEETLYRGFALWYLAQFMPLWAAVVVSSLFFGLGHSYQGPSGCLRTGLVGLAFGFLYVLTGSLWLPIVGHALLDVLQGAALFEILRDQSSHSSKSPSSSGSSISTRPRGSGGSGSGSPSSGSA